MEDRATRRVALFIATLGSFMVPFMLSSINIGLPDIDHEFRPDAVMLSWVATSYLLAAAVSLVPFGKLADIYGRKRLYLIGMGGFALSSLLCSTAPSVEMLVFFRIFQGSATAMIFATGIAIITSVFPPTERGRVLGVTVAAVYTGLAGGPFVGGWMTHYFGWRSLFVVNLPLGLTIIALVLAKLKGEWAGSEGESFDLAGALIYALAVVFVMLGISLMPAGVGFLITGCGIVFAAVFVKWEKRVRHPVFEVDLFERNRIFAFSCLAALIHYSATFGVTFLLSLYLQYIKEMTPQSAGTVLTASPVMMALFSPLAGRLSDRLEPRLISSIGMGLTGVGLILLTFIDAATPSFYIVSSLMVLGFGFALFSSPNMNAIMGAVDKRHYGIASGAVGTMRVLGQMFSMGIATLIFALFIGHAQMTPEYYDDLLKSIQTALLVFAALCGGGLYFSLSRGRLRPEKK
jgi:EmrB/QacA subfamily drug resistance transporter